MDVSPHARCCVDKPVIRLCSAESDRSNALSLAAAPQAPDVLHRPAPRPFAVLDGAVAALGVRRRAQLDQVLDLQAAAAEQRDPLAVGKLEGDRLAGFLEAADALPVVDREVSRRGARPRGARRGRRSASAPRTRTGRRGAAAARPRARSGAGSVNVIAPKSQKTTSKLSRGRPVDSALAWTRGNSTPAAAISSRACSSWRAELSRPVGRAPWPASAIDHCAAPQPSSSTSSPATSPSTRSSDSGICQHAPGGAARLLELAAVLGLVVVCLFVPDAAVERRVVGEMLIAHRASLVPPECESAMRGICGAPSGGEETDDHRHHRLCASPDGGKGLARDMRVRWAFEEVGQPYEVRLLSFDEKRAPAHLARQSVRPDPDLRGGRARRCSRRARSSCTSPSAIAGLLPDDAECPGAGDHVDVRRAEHRGAADPRPRGRQDLWRATEPWSEERLPLVEGRIRARLGQLSERLGDAEWLDGAFSAGDLMMVSVLLRLRPSGLLGEYPKLGGLCGEGRGEAGVRAGVRRAAGDQRSRFQR